MVRLAGGTKIAVHHASNAEHAVDTENGQHGDELMLEEPHSRDQVGAPSVPPLYPLRTPSAPSSLQVPASS
eukprot:1192365-Prorocentrum_minimum.AAC.2